MTAVTADHPGREETWDPLVCMAKSALHGNRRAAGGETHRQHPSRAASLTGSIPHGQHIPQGQHMPHGQQIPHGQHPSQAASLAGSASLAAEPSSPARLCSCRSDGKPQPPKHLHSRLAPQQAFTNKLKRRKRSLQLFRCWRDGRCWQGVLLQASKHVPALALEGNGIWIYG